MGTKRGLISTIILLGATASASIAGSFCDGLNALGAALDQHSNSIEQSFALPESQSQQAGCRTSLSLSGGRSVHCMWAFEYREQAASLAFEQLIAGVEQCGAQGLGRDQNVSHPDYYDLRRYELGGRGVSVSLKDKGALQQTLVFLNVRGR